MLTLFEQITHWMTISEWESIKLWTSQAVTWERYYNIVKFVKEHRNEVGYPFREKILGSRNFIDRFGHLDLEYLKYAEKIMRQKSTKNDLTPRD